ncbi:MAG: fibronectin type III domain-containing protein [Firmicutes bacterium]|nr:fibronectin type III domain-containing protein [Bacillota bacterium]
MSASLSKVTGSPAPTAPRTGGGGGAPAPSPADTQAPTWPAGSQLTATGVTADGVTLSWPAASDNVAVTAYRIYRDGRRTAEVAGNVLTYRVTGLSAGTRYTFEVEAGDGAGNWSADRPSVTATTRTAPPAGLAVVPVPAPSEVHPGQEVALEVRVLNVDGTSYPAGLYAADVTLVYDPRLELQYGEDGKPAVIPLGAFGGGLLLFPQAEAGQGPLRFALTLTGSPKGLAGDVPVAVVTFKARHAGTATVTVTAADLVTVGTDGKAVRPDLSGVTLGSCTVTIGPPAR